jgi:hypothetical protein
MTRRKQIKEPEIPCTGVLSQLASQFFFYYTGWLLERLEEKHRGAALKVPRLAPF